jgi:hypothetical protein
VPSASFRFLHYSIPKFRVYISGGINPEVARVIFRAACYSRRPLLRFEPERFLPYFIRELSRAGSPITIDTVKRRAELTFTVDIDDKNIPLLRITSALAAKDAQLYVGGFYAWLGNSDRIPLKRGRKSREEAEQRRLQFKAAEAASPSNNNNRTSHLTLHQRELYDLHKIEMKRRGNIAMARHDHRRESKKSRQLIRDHYSPVPGSTKD